MFHMYSVINTIAKSKRPGKAKLALDILRRMEEAAIRPVTVSFNNVLNACAFTNLDHDEPEQILKIALDVLREVQKGPGANWITYQTAIRVVCSFEQDPRRRWDLTREIFQQCCNDGQLTRTVMAQVRFSVTESQFAMLDNEATDPVTRRLLDQYSANARQSMKAQKTRIVST